MFYALYKKKKLEDLYPNLWILLRLLLTSLSENVTDMKQQCAIYHFLPHTIFYLLLHFKYTLHRKKILVFFDPIEG
jgi:hypothetical protein